MTNISKKCKLYNRFKNEKNVKKKDVNCTINIKIIKIYKVYNQFKSNKNIKKKCNFLIII